MEITTTHTRSGCRPPGQIGAVEVPPGQRLTLLTGASGYVGGQLLRRLERSGRRVRCLTRRPEALRGRVAACTEVAEGDVLDPSSLARSLAGVHTACYLV